MAIIKTKLIPDIGPNGTDAFPDHCILKESWFFDLDTGEFITIGLGGGTELTKAELLAHVKDVHSRHPFENYSHIPPDPPVATTKTEAELETMVNEWCTERNV